MEMVSRNGIQYRTRLMGLEQAARFARCLRANRHFTGVVIEESRRSRGRWMVIYHPVNPDRLLDMHARQQGARSERAATMDAYLFVADVELSGVFHCLTPAGEVYQVTEYDCTCPDHEYRCRHAHLACKHRERLVALQNSGLLIPAPADPGVPEPTPEPPSYADPFADDPFGGEVDPGGETAEPLPWEPETEPWEDGEPGVEPLPVPDLEAERHHEAQRQAAREWQTTHTSPLRETQRDLWDWE